MGLWKENRILFFFKSVEYRDFGVSRLVKDFARKEKTDLNDF